MTSARSTRRAKPSPTQLKILTNIAAGRDPFFGRPFGRAHTAGWGQSLWGCINQGWLKPGGVLTIEGRAVLEKASA